MSWHQVAPVAGAFVPLLLAFGLFVLADLERFVLVAVMAAMILPQALLSPGGAQLALGDVLIVVALAAWLARYSIGRAPIPYIRGNPFVLPGLLFVGYNAISFIWSSSPSSTLKFAVQLLEIVVLGPLLFATIPRSLSSIRLGMTLFVFCTAALAIFTLFTYSPHTEGRLAGGGVFGGLNKNVVGSYVAAGLIISVAFWSTATSVARRRIFGVLALAEVAGLLATISRGSIIGGLIAVCVASLLLRSRRILVVTFAIITAIGYLATIGVHSNADLTAAGSYDSSLIRHYSYRGAVDHIRDKPILGSGAGTYVDYIPELQFFLPDPNNMFLLTWAELGIGGMLMLLFVLYRFLRLLLAVRTLEAEEAALGVAAGCIALSFFIHFQFDVTWTRGTTTLTFCMIGLMAAVQRIAAIREAPLRPPVLGGRAARDPRPRRPAVPA